MGFDTDIYDGVAKMRAYTLLEEIVCLYQNTKNPLKYFHTNSKYGQLLAIPYYDNNESFSRDYREKSCVDKILLPLSCGKKENKVVIAQYL